MYYKNERETCNHFVMNRNINLKISNSTRIHIDYSTDKRNRLFKFYYLFPLSNHIPLDIYHLNYNKY